MKPARLLLAATLLVVLVNSLVLAGVAWNRHGTPDSVLTLSEREIWPNTRVSLYVSSEENSSRSVHLRWAVVPAGEPSNVVAVGMTGPWGAAAWLDQAKLAALGFDVSRSGDDLAARLRYERMLPKVVFLVLELNGPAYTASLAGLRDAAARAAERAAAKPEDKMLAFRAQSARERVDGEEHRGTRLFVMDAGLDAAALRARYPDRSRYAIARGAVRPQAAGGGAQGKLFGQVTALYCETITLPPRLHAALPEWQYGVQEPPTTVVVAFGRRFEPWIESVARTPAAAAAP